jgi:hypothetical protein
MSQDKLVTSYQVQMRDPNGRRSNYWGIMAPDFVDDIAATRWARNNCPSSWEWRVVKLTPKVVASGSIKPKEPTHVRLHQSNPAD